MKRIREWLAIGWRQVKRILPPLVIALLIIGLGLLIRAGYTASWTGFGGATRVIDPNQEVVPAKTLWDWLELLIIPLVLAIGGLWFSRAERRNEQEIARKRIEEERKIAQERIEEDRRIAEENTQQTTLQIYLEQMSGLLMDKDLRHSEPESESRAIARSWTLTVLRRLDGERKGLLLRFLYESDLISENKNVLSLVDTDLRGATLAGATLEEATLEEATLEEATLRWANLVRANLKRANLIGANLAGATLKGANLAGATLKGANLKGANLRGANLAGATLAGANLKGANLRGANLWAAFLKEVRLEEATYSGSTTWPVGFDPVAAGAIFVEEENST